MSLTLISADQSYVQWTVFLRVHHRLSTMGCHRYWKLLAIAETPEEAHRFLQILWRSSFRTRGLCLELRDGEIVVEFYGSTVSYPLEDWVELAEKVLTTLRWQAG